MLSAEDAVELYSLIESRGIRSWVVGGWGVDALVGRVTRSHKDLDVLVMVDDLPNLNRLLAEHGFVTTTVWEESRTVSLEGEIWNTAFVATDSKGRELDVHVVYEHSDGQFVALNEEPWALPGGWATHGHIGDVTVACVTASCQVAMHVGYELPPTHRQDLALMQAQLHE